MAREAYRPRSYTAAREPYRLALIFRYMENSEPDTDNVSRHKRGRSHLDRSFQRGFDFGLVCARSGLQTASNVAHAAGVDASSTDSDKVSQGLRVAGLKARARPAPEPHRSEAAVESQRLLLRKGRPLAGNGHLACHWCHAEASLTCATCGRSECETCRFQYSDKGGFALEEAHCMPCRHNNSLKEKSKAAAAARDVLYTFIRLCLLRAPPMTLAWSLH